MTYEGSIAWLAVSVKGVVSPKITMYTMGYLVSLSLGDNFYAVCVSLKNG
jgi:hypothetical protein